MKEFIITLLVAIAFMGLVFTVSAIRTEKIENGEMVLVNQNQMDR